MFVSNKPIGQKCFIFEFPELRNSLTNKMLYFGGSLRKAAKNEDKMTMIGGSEVSRSDTRVLSHSSQWDIFGIFDEIKRIKGIHVF